MFKVIGSSRIEQELDFLGIFWDMSAELHSIGIKSMQEANYARLFVQV